MVASSVGGASSVRSKTIGAATPAKVAPHMLGGSKNLMTERFRREQAEQTLLQTRQSLKAIATDLAPQVDELSKAIKIMQIEKHHQLNLDETSQEVLEGLQRQIDEIHARDDTFSALLDERMENVLAQVKGALHVEKCEIQELVAQVQDAQDTLTAEVHLLRHEVSATKQFLVKQVDTMEDAIDCIRNELVRAKDQQALTNEAIQTRAVEMDEKLFSLDKELLKFKLALPSSVSAQLPPQFVDRMCVTEAARAANQVDAARSGVGTAQKLQELASSLESLKAEVATYRAADRQQFDAVTNRLRESLKQQQILKRDIDSRFQEIHVACDSMITKVPSELSRRLLQAQAQWTDELKSIRSRLDERGSSSHSHGRLHNQDSGVELYDAKALRSMDTALRHHIERLDELQSSVLSLKTDLGTANQGYEATVEALRSAVGRLEHDVLGLYDWAKREVGGIQEEVAFTTNVLQYFQQHAKILPKS